MPGLAFSFSGRFSDVGIIEPSSDFDATNVCKSAGQNGVQMLESDH